MTINLQHFDTKLKQDLEVQEQIKNSLAEYLFPETEFALGMVYKDAATATDLTGYQDKTLQFASGERLYFASQPVRELLYPNKSDGAAYGSLVFTPNKSFIEKKDVRILIIDDSSGANGEIMPPDVAKNLVGDCYGKISIELASELIGSSNTPFQFRIGIKPQAENEVYRIAKGTLAPANLDTLNEPYFRSGRNQSGVLRTKHGYDLILATSSFKGRKGEDAIRPGEYVLTLGVGVKSLAEYGEHSLGTQVLVNYPRGVQADILSELKEQAVELATVQSDPRAIAQLYIEKYERRQSSIESSPKVEVEVGSDLAGLNTAIDEAFGDEEIVSPEQKKQDMLLYRLLKANLENHPQLLEHPKVIDGLNKFVRKQWSDIATGRAIKFNSGLAQPSWNLAKDQICVLTIPEGQEVIVTRSPLVNSNGVIVLTNKYLLEARNQQGTIHIHPETAAEHLQADFDGDRLAFEVATKYPTLAAEIKEYNLEQNRYPDVVKAKKVAYTGSFEEIALSARENKIGIIANQIQKAVALQWETQLIPAEKRTDYLKQISNYYKGLLKNDGNPSKELQLPAQFKDRIERLADFPQQVTPQKTEELLREVKKLLFDVVSELSNELQVAVDGPKSAARPNVKVLNYCKAISEYTPIGWLADKKKPEVFLNRAMNSTNYSPIDLMVQQTNKLFNESWLIARPTIEFNPLFQGVAFTEKHEAYAKEISSTYKQIIKQALSLDEKARKEEGPSIIVTSSESGKQIEITNLLKFNELNSPVWSQSHLDIKLYPNTNKSLKNSLMAVVMADSENKPIYQPIGTVSEESMREHNLRTGIKLTQASVNLTPGATANQVKAKFHEAAQYLDDVRRNTPENEQLSLAAAIWHISHGRSAEDSSNLKKASVAFNAFPDLVVNQLSKLQFTNLTVVGVHQPTNELLGRRWNTEKVQAAIAKDTDSNSPNYGKKIVVVEGKKFAPLSIESPSLPIGTQFKATVVASPGAAVIGTTPKGNSLRITQVKNHAFADQEWKGELTQIQVGFLSNTNPSKPSTPVALVNNKVVGVFDKESLKKLQSANLLKTGATLSVSLQTTTGTTASITVDPISVVYPHQQQPETRPAPTAAKQQYTQISLPDKSLTPDDWARVARALGKSAKYVERVTAVTQEHKNRSPLTERALTVMQQDFNAYKQISNDLRQWHVAAEALGKSVAYQDRIISVAIAFHDSKQPTPLSEKAIVSMQKDLHDYQQLSFGEGHTLSDIVPSETKQPSSSLPPPSQQDQNKQQLNKQQEALLSVQAIKILFNQLLIDTRIRQANGSWMFEAAKWRFAQQGEEVTITDRQDNREVLRVDGKRVVIFAPTPEERTKLEEFRHDIAQAIEEKQQQQNSQQYEQQRQRGARI